MRVVSTTFRWVDCVGMPNLDQQQRPPRPSTGHFEVRYVASAAGDHRALDFDDHLGTSRKKVLGAPPVHASVEPAEQAFIRQQLDS